MRLWPCLLAVTLAGCGDDLGIERVLPNSPPETTLRSGPPDSTATDYRVRVQWSGSDADGSVDHFDVIVVDHPAVQSHVEGDPADTDPTRVVVTVPSVDDPRWAGTAAVESTFVTLADTLRRDPHPGPGETPDDVRRALFERWHTVFVRAVDNRGLPDATPDYVTFNATNLAPTVHLLAPVACSPDAEFEAPPVIVFNWDGEDPIDASSSIEPVASRYVIISSRVTVAGTGDKYTSFPDSLYTLPQRYQWSTWQRWERSDGSGRRAVVYGLASVGEAPGAGYYLFAVQAMDEAGAVTPVFDYQSCNKNNVARVRVSGSVGPHLILHEAILGTFVFVGGSGPQRIDISAGQAVAFRWEGDASSYGGEIVGYRYGWDLRDPTSDDGWTAWNANLRASVPRSFPAGMHRFYLQVRDSAGLRTEATLELACHALTRRYRVLRVDDSDFLTVFAEEDSEDARWKRVLGRLGSELGFDFDPVRDVYDVRMNRREPPPPDKLFDYRVVVWSVRRGRWGSGLRLAGQFFDPYPQRNQNLTKSYSYLFSYLGSGGALWISGFRPAKELWADERPDGREFELVNVTNWDDPLDPHASIDSVGTNSLLYRMGIEMFDTGAGLDSPRNRKEHYCRGLRRSDIEGLPDLVVGTFWPHAGTEGRANIEIYNMPAALSAQLPPLQPPPGRTAVAYTYISGVAEDPAAGVVYPATADRQPVFILAKAAPTDAHFSRAFCGFEIYLLGEASHLDLTRFVLQAFQPIP